MIVADARPMEQIEVAPSIPHSREAEEATLGAVLINPDVWPEVSLLQASDFYIHRHRWIWDAFAGLHEQGKPIDLLTVSDALDRGGQLEEIGGRAYLTALVNQVPSSLNARSYAGIVKEKAARRAMIADANRLAADAYDESKPPAIALIEDPSEYSTWADMDTGPMEWAWKGWLVNGLLTLLVSYSGDGKSLLALRICGCFIEAQPWPDGTTYGGEKGKVLWVECEAAQALNLLRANTFKYPLDGIVTPLVDPLEDVSLDNPEHRAIVEARAALPEIKFIVIDSLSGSSHRKENETGIKEITLWAAKLARDLNKPVLMVHHLGKKKEWDTEAITLDRVRGSSAIVQFARVVWALSCPDATNRDTKRLEQIKNNLGRFPEAIGMRATEQGIDFGTAPKVPHVETQGERTSDFLLDLLEGGPMKMTDIDAELHGAGLSLPTAKRQKERLGIVSVKKPDGWYWSLPAKEVESD
jgi:hypothetical protein